MKYNYLIIVKFFAGSDDINDVDNGVYLFTSNKPFNLEEMKELFKKVNYLLDTFNEEKEDFPISYEEGLNLDTLIKGVEIYSKASIVSTNNFSGYINGIYTIEQWQ